MFKHGLVGILCLVSTLCFASQAPVFKDLTIIVSSCDKYQEFWDPFFDLLFKQWPSLLTINRELPIVLITNKLTYPKPRVISTQTGEDKSWSNNMSQTLKKVKTRYVLYLQEDYFIANRVDEKRLAVLLLRMQKENSAYFQIGMDSYFDKEPTHPKYADTVIKDRFMKYRTSLQAAFWRTDILLRLLNPKENPWEFEILGSNRSSGVEEDFWALQEGYPIQYINACGAGYWNTSALKYLQDNHITVNVTLPIDKDHQFKLWLKEKHPTTYRRLFWLVDRL